MKLTKKIGLIGVGLVVLLVIAYCISFYSSATTPDDGSAQKEMIEFLNNDVDLSILLYGENISFPEELEYETIESLDNENWQRENDYIYLIINDLSGTAVLDKEKYIELLEYAEKNTNFNFYYIGTDDLQMIRDNTKDSNIDLADDMSFGYVVYEGNRLNALGLWTRELNQYIEKNPNLLSEMICNRVRFYVESNE